jgi:hypothetical protein
MLSFYNFPDYEDLRNVYFSFYAGINCSMNQKRYIFYALPNFQLKIMENFLKWAEYFFLSKLCRFWRNNFS